MEREAETRTEGRATDVIRRRYNRFAPLYDFMEGRMETARFRQWRALMWSRVEGKHVLEVGVGTGRNFPYYPGETEITAVDFSEGMLKRARAKAARQGIRARLLFMDAQHLAFEDNTFDAAVASMVFCTVPDPILGLKEMGSVVTPGGKIVLLEHVLSANRILAWFMNLANPLALRMIGDNINRKTVEIVVKSGLLLENVTDLSGIFKLIEARKRSES